MSGILLPKYGKRIGGIVRIGASIRGEFRSFLWDYKGRLKHDTGWNDNLITDHALLALGVKASAGGGNWVQSCHIGDDDTPPVASNTSLNNGLAGYGYSAGGVETYGWGDFPPWQAFMGYWRFYAGEGTGTIREMGVSNRPSSSPTVDGSGRLNAHHLVPTPFVKGATDVLDVWYRATWYHNLTDVTGQIVLDGLTYDYLCRWGGLGGTSQGFTWGYTWYNPVLRRLENFSYSDGELGDVYSGLDGGEITSNYDSAENTGPGPDGDHWNTTRYSLGLDAELASKTVRCMYMGGWVTAKATKVRFGLEGTDAPIPFTDKDIMWIDHEWHYAKYVP